MQKIRILAVLLLTIAAGVNAQEISPWLFGQNHWIGNNDEGDRPGYIHMLWPKIDESGIEAVRIGGAGYEGNFPGRAKLTAMIDSIQGIGAEPILQVPSTYTAEEVTDLVNYFNKNPKRQPIKFWSIGNEPLLHVRNNEELMLKEMEVVYQFITRLAPAMKAADPTIKIFVYDGSGLPRNNTEQLNYVAYEAFVGGRLDITGKDKNGNWMVDGINFHNYPNGRGYQRDDVIFTSVNSVKKATSQLLELIDRSNKKHGRTGENKLLWGLTEINVTASGNPNREISGIGCPSFLGGQFIAEIYGIGLENGAFTVAPWCINETDQMSTDFGYIGLPMDFFPRSSYYHTQMMAENMKGEFLPVKSNNSYVKTIGSKSDDEICVMILNQDQTHDFEFDLVLNNEGGISKPLTVNADAGLDKTISGTIPNQTTLLFVFSNTGEVKKQYIYGLTHNLQHLPPEVK